MTPSPAPFTDVPVNSASTPETTPTVQELHQGTNTLEMQRQLLAKKLAEKKDLEYTSPTDQMMTPCTKKLQDYKAKAFNTKGKPTSLSSRFRGVDGAQNASASGKENKSGTLFGN